MYSDKFLNNFLFEYLNFYLFKNAVKIRRFNHLMFLFSLESDFIYENQIMQFDNMGCAN